MAASKTNRTARSAYIRKGRHECPDCGETAELYRLAKSSAGDPRPQGMRGRCEKGHDHPKRALRWSG